MPIWVGHNAYPTILKTSMYPIAALIHGKIGGVSDSAADPRKGCYVFKQYGLNRVICKYSYPTRVPSAIRSVWEGYLAQAVSNWQGFPEATKNFYRFNPRPVHMSGYNRYLKAYLLSMRQFVV